MKNICVLIPAYNEEKTLGRLLKQLLNRHLSVFVIDDGSTDGTARIAQDSGACLLKNEKNSGKGLSLKKGIDHLLNETGCEHILIMDGDMQHDPGDIDKFITAASRGEDCVVGNRMHNPEGMPWLRIMTNKLMSWLISVITGQKIPDTQCGYRLFKKDLLSKLDIRTENFQIETEMLIQAAARGAAITSVPVASIYHKDSSSKINPIIDTVRFVKYILTVNGKG